MEIIRNAQYEKMVKSANERAKKLGAESFEDLIYVLEREVQIYRNNNERIREEMKKKGIEITRLRKELKKRQEEITQLKPCPFCGGKARLLVDEGVKVICEECGCKTEEYKDRPYVDEIAVFAALERWNRREQ